MRDALKSYLALAGGVTELTRQRAVTAAKQLVQQGEATAGQVQELAEDLLQQSRQNREAVTALVRFEVDRTLGRVGLATQEEVEQLRAKVRSLESQLSGGGPAAAKAASAATAATTASTTAGTTAAGKANKKAATTPAKKAPAKKAAAKKAPAQKAAAKKAPAKKAATKAPAGSARR